MKTKILFGLSLLCSAMFSHAYDLTQLQDHLDRQQFKKLHQAVSQLPETPTKAELRVMQAKAMLSLKDDEALEELLPNILKDFPKHAELNYLASANQFNLAQSGSMFSAPGRAKKGLEYLKLAVQLDPTNARYQRGLIGFYLSAPSIAGGDEKEAQRLADALLKQDVIQGTLAQADILQKNEQAAEALALIDSQLSAHPESTHLLEAKAAFSARDKKAAEAFALYQKALALYPTELEKYGSLYQLGRLAAVEGQDTAIGTQALQQYLAFYQDSDNPMLPWAQLRLAQIQLRLNDKAAASATIAPLLAQKNPQERLQKELKSFEKQLKSSKS
ncbi:MAG: tetratricopeptide repeat protein [Rheinheimera sp.]